MIFAENLVATPIHMFLRRKFTNWSTYWRYLTIDELNGLLSSFSNFEVKSTGMIALFGANEKQRYYFSRIDDLILNRITKDSYKYIAYGYAVK